LLISASPKRVAIRPTFAQEMTAAEKSVQFFVLFDLHQ